MSATFIKRGFSVLIMLFILSFDFAGLAFCQTVTVVDDESREPLIGVSIYSEDGSVSEVTGSKGQASLGAFSSENVIIFQYLGYRTLELRFEEIIESGLLVVLQRESLSLGETVVSANRWAQNSREVPVTIARITPEEIRFQNPQTAADLLGVSNEIFIQKSQMGGGSPMIRGFATNRVLLVVDGVRMNNAIFRSGNLQNVISLDPNTIENTEVIFGPGSVIYGSDAIGGVMSFNTLSPKLSASDEPDIEGNAAVRTSSANWEKTGHVDVNLGFKNWASITSLSYSDFDDMRMGSYGPDEYLREEYVRRVNGEDRVLDNSNPEVQRSSGYSQLNFMQKLRFRPGDDWGLNLGLHYSTTDNIPRYDRLIERRNEQFREGEWYYGPQQWLMANATVHYLGQTRFYDQVKATIAFQDYEESRNDRGYESLYLRNREEQVKAYSVNFDFERSISSNSKIFYGLEAVINKVYSEASETNINTGESTLTSTRYPDNSTWQSYAGFLNYKNNLNEKWTLTAGARFNQYFIDATFDDHFFNFPFKKAELNTGALTGSLGMVFRPGDTWQINGHISTGFRAPNIDDVGKVFDSEPGSVVVPNPELVPEYAYNFELGIQKLLGGSLKLDAAFFYTILEEAMVRREFTLNGQDSVMYDGTLSQVQAIQNVAEASVWGIQAGIEFQFNRHLELTSDISFQDGREEGDNGEEVPLRHVAPLFGSTHLIWKPVPAFRADLYADYNGRIANEDLAPSESGKPHLYAINDQGNPYSPAWYTLNLKTSYEIGKRLSLSFGIENITDQRYRPYSSGIAAPGRNIIVGMRGEF